MNIKLLLTWLSQWHSPLHAQGAGREHFRTVAWSPEEEQITPHMIAYHDIKHQVQLRHCQVDVKKQPFGSVLQIEHIYSSHELKGACILLC
jgi:hypothetical protein